MKNKWSFIRLFAGAFFLILGCSQKQPVNDVNGKEINGKIVITSVKAGGKICGNNDTVEVPENAAELVIEFAENYKGLSVTVNNEAVPVYAKKAVHTIKNITEMGSPVRISVQADNKKNEEINFTVKKSLPTEIKISKITLGTIPCYHNSIAEVNFDSGLLVIEFLEKYEKLSVKVNNVPAIIADSSASFNLTEITESGKLVRISVEAAGKIRKDINFTAKKKAAVQDMITVLLVSVDGKPCRENEIFECASDSPKLVIEFKEAYENLKVKVNSAPASVSGNKAGYSFSGITEDKIKVDITAEAKNKTQFTFSFFLKLKPLQEIVIQKVLLGTKTCTHKGEVFISGSSAQLAVEFKEAYANLKVTVNGAAMSLSGNVASFNLTGLTKEGSKISIAANADGCAEKRFWFTAKNDEPVPPQSSNADLKNLQLVSGAHTFDFDTEFNPAKTDYTVNAAARYTEFTLKAEAADAGAVLSSVQKEKSGEKEVFKITVTASGGTAKTYSVTVEKIPALQSAKRELAAVPVPEGGIEFPVNKDDTQKGRLEKKFSIGKYAVTYELWKEVYVWAAQNGYKFNYSGKAGRSGADSSAKYPNGSPIPPDEADEKKYQPAVEISWRDAVVWCNAYSVMDGLNAVYYYIPQGSSGKEILKDATASCGIEGLSKCDKSIVRFDAAGYRIPSELEWRLAARWQGTEDKGNSAAVVQTDGATYYFTKGDSASGAASSSEEDAIKTAWFGADGNYETHPVGEKLPNALGIFDMSGNIYEWLFDTDGAKKRYSIGGHIDQELEEMCVGADSYKDLDSNVKEDYLGLRIVKNEK